jgi:ABC-2 type transport system permease protein
MTPPIIAANLAVRLRSFSREKSAMFFTIAFPVILVLVFGAIFTKPEHLNFDLPVQDLDQSTASAQLVKSLTVDRVFKIISIPSDAHAVQYAKDHKLNLVLVIPRGFEEVQARRLLQRDGDASVVLTYIYDPSSTSVTTKLQFLNSIVAAANQSMSGTRPFITMAEQSILDKKYRFIEFFVPGIIAMAVMTSSLSGALNMNAELRQKGILRKLATTPITRADWMLSNILYQLVLAFISTASILLVSRAVFDVRLPINGWLPVYLVLEVFVFVGIGMMLTPIAGEAESAAAAANAFLFPMMFLSGTFFPVEMMPAFLQKFARILPLYYVNEGLRASMIFIDNMAAARCAAITGAVAAAVFAAGALVTRWDRGA